MGCQGEIDSAGFMPGTADCLDKVSELSCGIIFFGGGGGERSSSTGKIIPGMQCTILECTQLPKLRFRHPIGLLLLIFTATCINFRSY